MKNVVSLFILSCLIVQAYAFDEIHSIEQVLPYLQSKQRTLVVFDIDNTLLHPKTDLGSDQWFSHMMKEQMSKGHDFHGALACVLPLYFHINLVIDLEPTEPALGEVIRNIQEHSDYVICLTARLEPLVDVTLHHLRAAQLHFHIPEFHDMVTCVAGSCLYKHGIIFCGPQDKGRVLTAFLEAINYQPECIMLVDDKESNLLAMEKAASALKINFIGLRYAGCDHRVRNFSRAQADQELQDFLEQHPMS